MTLFVSLGHPLERTLFNAATWFVIAVVIWHFQARRERNAAAKLGGQDGILVYVRYPDTRPGSLSGIWTMGVATFDGTAGMKFQPVVYDTLEPAVRPTTFRALAAVSPSPGRSTGKSTNTSPVGASRPFGSPPTKGTLRWPLTPDHSEKSATGSARQRRPADRNTAGLTRAP